MSILKYNLIIIFIYFQNNYQYYLEKNVLNLMKDF